MGAELSAYSQTRLAVACLEARRTRSRPVLSGYGVGAALLTEDGRLFSAGNIECYGQTPSICAERVALFKALSEGADRFAALAVSGGPLPGEPETFCTPCGVCRQVLMQFCSPDMPVLSVLAPDSIRIWRLGDLLPECWAPPASTNRTGGYHESHKGTY